MAKKLLKPKRGKVENLSKLAVEDGALVFAYDTKATTSTVLVDIGDTRYDLAAGAAKKANNADALGGSSLQNIVDKINNSTGDGTAFTGLDTATNNKIKLTRANGGTVEKTINNVSNASTADYAKSASNASTAFYLGCNPTARPADLNIGITGAGGIRTFIAEGNVTNKAPFDAHIIHLDWDSTGGQDAQIAIEAAKNGHMAIRGMSSAAWGNWNTVLDSANYTSYAANKNAYNSASISNATITLGRSDSSIGTTLTVNNVANASTAEYAKDAGKLGGVEASKYATKEDIPVIPSNLDVANRLQSFASAGNISNSLFYRYGVLNSSWSNFPVSSLPSTGIGTNFQGKNTGVLHIAAGSSYHDLAFTAGVKDNQGILYASTGRNPAYILDTENYKIKGNVFNSLTANTSFTAKVNVTIDGGSY